MTVLFFASQVDKPVLLVIRLLDGSSGASGRGFSAGGKGDDEPGPPVYRPVAGHLARPACPHGPRAGSFRYLHVTRTCSLRSNGAEHTEVEFTIFPPSRVYLGFLKLRLESRFQEVVIHQFRAKNVT